MIGTRNPRGPNRITITEDDEAFWVTKGKIGHHSYSHEGAMHLASRVFLETGREGKAVIIDLANLNGCSDA